MSNNMDVSGKIPLEPAFGKDANGKDAVAIMLATDDNYAPYASVMIQSIKENASANRNYDIVVVGSLSDNNKKLLEGMAKENIAIRVVDINPLVESIGVSIFALTLHFTIETYYRFFIPRLFSQYEKVLYLDVDMVALHDVAELFDTDMGDNWWAVTNDRPVTVMRSVPGTWHKDTFAPYLTKTLKMDSESGYFQAGVMLWNVRQCLQDNVFEQLIDKLKVIGTPKYVDQDVMNSLANGKHIRWFPSHWNAQTWCPQEIVDHSYFDSAYIIHFGGATKPWHDPNLAYADKFWQYAKKTPFYEQILLKMLLNKPPVKEIKENHDLEIKRCKRKVKQYRILQTLTLGLVKSFPRRKSHYRNRIKQLATM